MTQQIQRGALAGENRARLSFNRGDDVAFANGIAIFFQQRHGNFFGLNFVAQRPGHPPTTLCPRRRVLSVMQFPRAAGCCI